MRIDSRQAVKASVGVQGVVVVGGDVRWVPECRSGVDGQAPGEVRLAAKLETCSRNLH